MGSIFASVVAWLDRAADPAGRAMRYLGLAAALAAAVSLVIGAIVWLWPDHRQYEVEQFLTDNPSHQPAHRSTDQALFGVRLGTPVARIGRMFPPENADPNITRAAEPDDLSYQWAYHGLRLVVEVDRKTKAATGKVSVFQLGRPTVYVSLPNGLLLGKATLSDAIRAYRRAYHRTAVFGGHSDGEVDTGYFFYVLTAVFDPQNGQIAEYDAVTTPTGVWGRWNAKACPKLVTGVTIGVTGEAVGLATPPKCR
jgi:hypothetical protein